MFIVNHLLRTINMFFWDNKFSAEQRDRYEQSLIQYRDLKSALETAVEEREIEIAKNAILEGLDNQIIVRLTGLAVKQIEQLRNEIKKNWWQHYIFGISKPQQPTCLYTTNKSIETTKVVIFSTRLQPLLFYATLHT